jgi:hypothetical protein
MQHSAHNRFDSYRPAFLLGGLVSAQRTEASPQARGADIQFMKPKDSKNTFRLWFKSKVSRRNAN